MEANFRSGTPKTIDYTAAADIAVGEVVILGNTTGLTCGIAHQAIANGADGSLAVGDAEYDVKNVLNAADYAKVYWDNASNGVTTTSTNNAQFGFVVANGGGGNNSTCRVLHHPYA